MHSYFQDKFFSQTFRFKAFLKFISTPSNRSQIDVTSNVILHLVSGALNFGSQGAGQASLFRKGRAFF